MKLSLVIDELVEQKGLERDVISEIICEGILAAYTKKYPDATLKVNYDKKDDEIVVLVQKEVVASPANDYQIGIRKAAFINKKLAVGDFVWLPFEEPIGRIEILRAKQIIAKKIRTIEAEAVYNEFKEKEGAIVYGVVHKCERAGATVKVQDTLAFLPRSLSIPGEKCTIGFSIRALLKEVLVEPRNENQLILDRSSTNFLEALFELEIPEVFEKLIEVKKIVRTPGYKSKVIVASNDANIDPVGTCVGVGGARIKPILKELGTEKIDIIAATENKELLVQQALKPAQVDRVTFVDDQTANVWVENDQRSLAIGKLGQNIALASKLTGMTIQLMAQDGGVDREDKVEATIEE